VDDFGIGPLRRTVVAPGGKGYELELTRLGSTPDASGLSVILDIVSWISGRIGGHPWGVTIQPHPLRFGPEREFSYRTRDEAATALVQFAASIPQDGLPDVAERENGGPISDGGDS
jgi:hypothetical protein